MSDAKAINSAREFRDGLNLHAATDEHVLDPSLSLQSLIKALGLQPHPEGGYYRETYRDATRVVRESALPNTEGNSASGDVIDDGALRSASTAIYYLLCGDAFSAWHRIRSDEIWHFYAGEPLDVHVLRGDGSGKLTHRLGNPLQQGSSRTPGADASGTVGSQASAPLAPVPAFQAVVKAGDWFAAGLAPSAAASPFALVGCTVAPGFTFSDFEIADPAQLRALHAAYPEQRDLIDRFTRPPESSPHSAPSRG